MIRKRFEWLAKIINQNQYRVGAEIGTATARTTSHIILNCPSIENYFVVDDWRPVDSDGVSNGPTVNGLWLTDGMKKVFDERTSAKIFKDKLTILEGVSWKMAEQVKDKSLDFVFIDASHDFDSVIKDLIAWAPKVRHKGILCGHDINMEGVKKALQNRRIRFKEAGIDKVWYIVK